MTIQKKKSSENDFLCSWKYGISALVMIDHLKFYFISLLVATNSLSRSLALSSIKYQPHQLCDNCDYNCDYIPKSYL